MADASMTSEGDIAKEAFRFIDEKRCTGSVQMMCFCPTMDLVAVALEDHQLILYRLSWQRVWTFTGEHPITSMAFRPDGRVLAVGFGSGELLFFDVESADKELYARAFGHSIVALAWKQCTAKSAGQDLPTDPAELYLPPLSSNSDSGEILLADISQMLTGDKPLNILASATDNGKVILAALGLFPLAILDIHGANITHLGLTDDLGTLSVGTKGPDGPVLLTYDIPLLRTNNAELKVWANTCCAVQCLTDYISATIAAMESAFEAILNQLDEKLTAFALQTGDTCFLENEFLALLLRGVASIDLQGFLSRELTPRKLKKLGSTIESSYSNIQKLVLENINHAVQAVLLRVNGLLGYARWDQCDELGMSESLLEECVSCTGSLAFKTDELLQVIESSISDFKAFFAWLCNAVSGMDEGVNSSLETGEPYDSNQVANFIKLNLRPQKASDSDDSKIRMERVRQYFGEGNLHFQAQEPETQYFDRDQAAACGPQAKLWLFEEYKDLSLLQVCVKLEELVSRCMIQPTTTAGTRSVRHYPICPTLPLSSSGDLLFIATSENEDTCSKNVYATTAFSSKPQELCVVRLNADGVAALIVSFANEECSEVLSSQWYSDALAVVLQSKEDQEVKCHLVLVGLEELDEALQSLSEGDAMDYAARCDVGPLITQRRQLTHSASSLFLSDTRKTGCVLGRDRRAVHLYDLAAEEDSEDEDEDEDEDEVNEGNESNISETDTNTTEL